MALTETSICNFGWKARDFALPGVDGRTYRLSDVRGKNGTLVIFMCAETIAEIACHLIEAGRPPATPIAIIRWGTYAHQEVYTGVLADIAASRIADFHIEPPAIAVVGEVVALRESLRWFGSPVAEILPWLASKKCLKLPFVM